MQTDMKENDKRQPVILFADDDQLCLDVGVRMLQKLGYIVLDAKDGKEAISIFKNSQIEVDLVILDMKMPHNGGATFDQLKKINAEVKVLIASGYTEDQQIREMMEQGCSGFLQKPFSINVLSQKILDALND
jgi:CheY-like chemotaxis protein